MNTKKFVFVLEFDDEDDDDEVNSEMINDHTTLLKVVLLSNFRKNHIFFEYV